MARNESAATAVEFGILALPFFTIIFAILETASVFFAGQILDSAVNDSSRLIRTGQAQTAGYTGDDYRDAICEGLYGLFDCTDTSKLRIKVTTISDFASAAPSTPIDPSCYVSGTNCNLTVAQTYEPGVGSSVVLVEAYYKWPTVVNLPLFNFATMEDGTRLLAAVRVFRNEPFGSGT
ncbi:MAG: TadE/TadG family type IV pilus assembly protein [Devosia sp.]